MTHIFASDYDGTLFKDHQITQHDLSAIEAFRNLGHKFGIVTGRSVDSIRHEIEKYSIPVDFVVGINGGVVLDHNFEELFASKIDQKISAQLIDMISQSDVHFYGTNDGYRISRTMVNTDDVGFEPNIAAVSVEEIQEAGVSAMYIWSGEESKAITLSEQINAAFGEHGIHSYPNTVAVDVGVRGITKSSGIEAIRNHYGYDGHVYAIGDSYNDVPMIRDFKGFLMSNGSMELEKYASEGLSQTVGDAIHTVLKSFK